MVVVTACVADPFQTPREIRENLGLSVSERLIRRHLGEAGLYICISVGKKKKNKPHLAAQHRKLMSLVHRAKSLVVSRRLKHGDVQR